VKVLPSYAILTESETKLGIHEVRTKARKEELWVSRLVATDVIAGLFMDPLAQRLALAVQDLP